MKLEKVSIETGERVKELANSMYAQIIKISPDEKFIAFMEFLHIYVAPYNQSANSFSLSGIPRSLTPGSRYDC